MASIRDATRRSSGHISHFLEYLSLLLLLLLMLLLLLLLPDDEEAHDVQQLWVLCGRLVDVAADRK
jgi:hypothetical protein